MCIWRLHWGLTRLSFADTFGIRQLESLGYRVALFATPICDRHTHDYDIYHAWRRAVKMNNNCLSVLEAGV